MSQPSKLSDNMLYSDKTGNILDWIPISLAEGFRDLRLTKQITLGYALMLFLMLLISGFSIYSVYRLDRDASNIEGRYTTLSSLISTNKSKSEYLGDDLLAEAIKIADEQVKYAYLTIFIVVGVVLLFGGCLTFIVPRLITRPILRLVDATEKVASGDFSHRVESFNGSSEISMLIRAFNNMLGSIEYHQGELRKKNAENLKLLEKMKKFNELLEIKIEEATKEIREKQEELINSERLATIGEMATGLAHEIRNPISGIAIALELMKKETTSQEHNQTISDILKELNRLERIIKELFQLGHPRNWSIIECHPNEIVEAALKLVHHSAKEKGIKIEKKLGCEDKFQVDPEQMEQVVINLLLNAIDSMEGPSGRLTVETASSNGSVLIKVTDTGCGISEEKKEKIFQPFYSTKKSGTGLGLSVSRRIIETHKGNMEIISEAGSGSTFIIDIPKNLGLE